MKKQAYIRIILSIVSLLLLCCASVSAEEEEDRTLRVGFFELSGYQMQDETGRRSGYGYDFLQKIGNYMDCTYEYVGYDTSYADCIDMLERGEVDIVTSVSRTLELMDKFLFSSRAIGTNSTILTVKAGNSSVITGDYSTYDGLRIGLLHDDSKNEAFFDFANKIGFTCETSYYGTESALTRALQAGEIDGIVGSSLRVTHNEWLIDTFGSSNFYVCVSKERPDLMKRINAAIEQLELDEPDWRTALHRKNYTLDTGGLIMLTADERAYMQGLLNGQRPLRVLMNPDRQPYSYFEDGVAKGIIPEIFRRATEQLGLPYEIVAIDTREEYQRLRESGEVDVVLDFASDFYAAEEAGYKITDAYLDAGFTRLMRRNDHGDPETVVTAKYSDALNAYVEKVYDSEQILYGDSVEDCVQMVLDGTADAAVLYTYTAEQVLQQDIRNRLTFMIMGDSAIACGVGMNVQKGYLLRSILNKAIAGLSEDERTVIIMRETESRLLDSRWELISFIYDNPIYGILAVMFLCLFVFSILLLLFRVRNQKQLESKIADVGRKYEDQKLELREALREAEAASQSKSIFLFNMSHDIRTPMNAIMGFADMAEKHLEDPEAVGNAIRKIQTSSSILLNLINDVLDLARIESGKTTLELLPQNILEEEKGIQLLFAEDMRKAELEFIVEHSVRDPYVMYDCLRMNQISINLLGNARKFTPAGGRVVYSLRQITDVEDGYATYQISVKDNGIGMSEEFQKRVFDRFERERSSTVSGVQGTGLGLSIVKRIVEMMDGTIEVYSKLGEGTEFVVTFRLEVVDEGEVIHRFDEDAERVDFSGRRLLLVEDNELNREIAYEILREEGFEIEVAEDGTVAVDKMATARPGHYDLILMDIQMPVMNGYEATRRIREMEDPVRASIPIIAMTANAFEEDRKMAEEAGMNGHLSKPIDTRKLLETLRQILNV